MQAKEFLESLPLKVKPEVIEGLNTVFHFDLSGEEGCALTLQLQNGKLEAISGLVGDPKCVIKSSGVDFMRLITKDLNPLAAILTGKVKVSNQGEMIKYAKIFGLL